MNAKTLVSTAAAACLAGLLGCSTPRPAEVALPAAPPPQPNSHPLSFAIYQMTGDGHALIAQGKLNYSLRDINVVPWGNKDGQPAWKKSLPLMNGFSIGTLVVRNGPIPGFGLWIKNDHHPAGFSWEWFDMEAGNVYKKLQGEGRVRITETLYLDGIEIRSVEFLADIALRFQEDRKAGPRNVTHQVVVSKGSVLRFAP